MNKAAIGIVEKLKACPFCGGEAEFANNPFTGRNTMALCTRCGAEVFWKKWNTRTPDPIIMEMVEALEEARIVLRENGFGEHAAVIVQIDATLTKVRGK